MRYNYYMLYIANKINIKNGHLATVGAQDKGYRMYIPIEYGVIIETIKKYFCDVQLDIKSYWSGSTCDLESVIRVVYDENKFEAAENALDNEYRRCCESVVDYSPEYYKCIRNVIWLLRYANHNQKLIIFKPHNGRFKDIIPDVNNPDFVDEILGIVEGGENNERNNSNME
jgi:hypothetical protein